MTQIRTGTIVRLTAFFALSIVMAMFLTTLLSATPTVSGSKGDYRAVFVDASYLKPGDPVRIAGVPVGKVRSIDLRRDSTVEVGFDATTRAALPMGVKAAVRYKNLLGDRYLELVPGSDAGTSLPKGGTIPVSRTVPAVDLDRLTGGFKPLFRALDPEQVNLLSSELIQVFEGQAGSVSSMLKSIGSFTSTLADNDEVIGDLIVSLGDVLTTLDDRNDELDDSVVTLQRIVTGLEKQRRPIASAVASINEASKASAALLQDGRPAIKDDVAQLRTITGALNAGSDKVNAALGGLGDALDSIAGIGVYGDFFNFYVCDVRVRFTGLDGEPTYTPWINSDVARCSGKPTGQ